MNPTGPHAAMDHLSNAAHLPVVDHTLATSVITSLAVVTPFSIMVADTAVRLISSALITVVTSLVVGWINRRMAVQAMRAEAARTSQPPPPPVGP